MDLDKQNGLIRAGLAHNACQLLEQYESFSIPPTQRFDVTLHLCVLQLLLANSVELVIATNNSTKRKQWLDPLEPFVNRLVVLYRHAGTIAAAMYRGVPPRLLRLSGVGTPGQQRNLARMIGVFAGLGGVLVVIGAFIA